MPITRYNRRKTIVNNADNYVYSDIFRNRNVSSVRQFKIAELRDLTMGEILTLQIETRVWGTGEKYFKLADEFYGDAEYWWILAWYNRKPLESDIKAGEVVEIPTPLELVLEYLDIY